MSRRSPIQPLRHENLVGLILGPCSLATGAGNDIGDRPVGLYQTMPFDTLFGTGLLLAHFIKPIRTLVGGIKR